MKTFNKIKKKEKSVSNFLSALTNQRRYLYLSLLNKTNHEELLYFFRKNIRNSQLFTLALKYFKGEFLAEQQITKLINRFSLLNQEIQNIIYNDVIKILNIAEEIEDMMITAYEYNMENGIPESINEEINEQLLEFINSYADIITFKLQVFNKFKLTSN